MHRYCSGALLVLQACALQPFTKTVARHRTAAALRPPHAIDEVKRRTSLAARPSDTDAEIDVQRTLATLIAAQVVLFIGVGAVIPVVAIYGRETLGLSASASGVVISAPALALLLGAKVSGAFADKARKPALIGGMLFIALSDAGTALASSLAPLVIARLGLGAGRCVSESAERGLLADLGNISPDIRGRAIAANQAGATAGIALGAPLGGLLSETYGPRACFLAVTGAALITAAIYTQLPETSTAARADNDEKGDGVDWLLLLEDGRWRGLTAAEICSRFGFAAKIASVPLLAAQVLPGGAAGAGALVSLAGLGGLVGAPVGGFGVDRVGARTVAVAAGLVGGGALCAVPAALSLEHPAALFSALIILWSAAVAAQAPALQALAQRLAPPGGEAEALALPRAAGDGVYIVVPFLLGLVVDAGAPRGAEIALAGVAGFVGVVAVFVALPSSRKEKMG